MKVELIIPIESLRGRLRKDGYYFRKYRGEQIVQRCPTTWKDTPARKAARERFAVEWGQRYSSKKDKKDPKKHSGSVGKYTDEYDNTHRYHDEQETN